MKICTQCGACFDDDYDACSYDQASLQQPFDGPRVLGDRYLLEQRIAAGAMGQVFRATHLQIGSTVAVKIMQPQKEALRVALARFHREAQVLGQLKHPNAILVMDFGVDDRAHSQVPYLVTEYLQGESLSHSMQTQEPYDLKKAGSVISPLCEAIAELHEIGIVHRDIKPSNVFLERLRDGTQIVKVLDFGIAKFLEYSETRLASLPEVRDIFDMVSESYLDAELEVTPLPIEGEASEDITAVLTPEELGMATAEQDGFSQEDWALTGADLVVGTLPYMAPEQLVGEPLSPQTDLYAIGVLLFRMLANRYPFEGSNKEVASSKLNEEPPSLLELGAVTDAQLSAFIGRCLSINPSMRPDNALEVVKALRDAITEKGKAPTGYILFETHVQELQGALENLINAITAWVSDIAEEEPYKWSRDALLGLDRPMENVLNDLDQGEIEAQPHEMARLRKPSQRISWSVEKLSRLIYGIAAESLPGAEYAAYVSTLWSRVTLSLDYICTELMEMASNHTPMTRPGDSMSGAASNPFQSPTSTTPDVLERLAQKLMTADVLENVEAFEKLLLEHRDLLFSVLAKPDATQAETLERLIEGLWRQAPDLLLLELYPAESPLRIVSLLADMETVPQAQGFGLLSSLFNMSSDDTNIISRVQMMVEVGADPKYRRTLLRCLTLHPESEVSQWAIDHLERSEIWHAIAYPHTPLELKKKLFVRVKDEAPPEYLKVFFFCVRANIQSVQDLSSLVAAFELLQLFFQVPCFHEDMVFEPLLSLDNRLHQRASQLKYPVPQTGGYQTLLSAFTAKGSRPTREPENMREIPLPIQRKIAREGHFLSFFVSHSNDKVALETLPHLYKKEDITRYLRIPTINRLVLAELAKRRRFFRKETPRLALLQNPKTQARVARTYLPFISDHQVRLLSENKHISSDVRQLAKAFWTRLKEKRRD
tara:strand:- start:2845 stop:5664 length:2820 start_codon:yes stop_codon:yes gene_type:complete